MEKVQAVDDFIRESTERKPRKWEGLPPSNSGPIQSGAFGFVPKKVNLSGTGIKLSKKTE
jgi:hypothetical protein